MGDKWKATDDDIPGAGQPPPHVARTETAAATGTSEQTAARPSTSQAPAGLTAATTPGFLFGGAQDESEATTVVDGIAETSEQPGGSTATAAGGLATPSNQAGGSAPSSQNQIASPSNGGDSPVCSVCKKRPVFRLSTDIWASECLPSTACAEGGHSVA
ncbi:uncharacterized protein [Triticum aestivum]|uniref:uncharacterized protein n=1 Tax=Triticum aestivum TaxID=4565 RepID=UPI001D031053|nr:uncharacterized protein LOC123115165 [Triticum aestivum]